MIFIDINVSVVVNLLVCLALVLLVRVSEDIGLSFLWLQLIQVVELVVHSIMVENNLFADVNRLVVNLNGK